METIDSAFPEFQASVLQSKKRWDRRLAPLCGILAFLFFVLLTPFHSLPPGAPAELTATAMGLPAQTPPFHLIWRSLAAVMSCIPLGTMTARLALLSAICSAIAVSLIYLVAVELMMYRLIPNGTSIDCRKLRAVQIGAVVAAMAFAISSPATLAATRASLRALDALLLLTPVWLFLRYYAGGSLLNLLLAGLVCGLGMGENPECCGIMIALLLAGIALLWRQDRSTLPMLAFAGLALAILLLVYPGLCYLSQLPGGDLPQLLHSLYSQFRQDYLASRTAMLICALSALPLLLGLATMNQTLNYGEEYESLLTLSTLATASLLVLTNAFPSFQFFALLTPEPPVIPYLFAAMTAGFVAGSWWVIAFSHVTTHGEPDEPDLYHPGVPHFVRGVGYSLAIAITSGVVFAGFLTLHALHNRPDWYPQRCAESILQNLGTRHWLFGRTPVNTHLAVLAQDRRVPLRIVPLTADDSWSTWCQQRVAQAVAHEATFEGLDRQQLQESLSLGPDVFLHTWLLADPQATDKLVIAGPPLTWTACGYNPVPSPYFFSGCAAATLPAGDFVDQAVRAELMRQQAASGKLQDATTLDVLASAGQALSDAAAYATSAYRRAGDKHAAAQLATYWSAPRTPSSARDHYATPLSWLWETTILPGRPERADILHTIRDDALLAAMDQKEDAAYIARRSSAAAGRTPTPADYAELYALARNSTDLAMINQGFSWLAQLDQAGAPASQLLCLRAEANIALAGGIAQAIALLQEATANAPHDLWAWHLLIAAHLQRGEIAQAANELLPAMEKNAGGVTNDLIRLTQAIVLCARGGTSLPTARNLFVEVANANPGLLVAREWALRLDVLLNDAAATTRDANILVACDENHAQANFILAGMAMRTRQMVEADRRFRQSLTGAITPQALTGRARLYCQQRKYTEALQLARKATTDYPAHLDGWLVLGDALEATGKPGEAAVVRSHGAAQ